MSRLDSLTDNSDSSTATLTFSAADVTGTHISKANVQRSLPARAIVDSLVASMSLPANIPYGLRDESTGAFLDDAKAIGEQIGADAKVTVTPKTHLG